MIAGLLLTSLFIKTIQGELPLPQIKDVQSDLKSRIAVSWKDEPSLVNKLERVIYEIEVYYTGQEKPVKRESVEITPNLAATHHWQWISPLPLECLPHSVRLGVRDKNDVRWTALRDVTGFGPIYSPTIYPQDHTVLVGTLKTFCCIIPYNTTISNFMYKEHSMLSTNRTHVGQTYIFKLTMEPSKTSGDDLICEVNKTKEGSTGSTVFVTYSPEVHNFTCETRNLSVMECSWTQGRDQNLKGIRKTKYSLNGRSCSAPKCSIKIPANPGEMVWNLTAKNYLNETSFTYRANPRHRVYLPAPQDLNAVHVNSTSASLEWHWPGSNLLSLPMRCHVQMIWPNKPEAVLNETGVGLHSVTLHGLHPYTNYSVQVRCTSHEHSWKWGDWSEKVTFRTEADIPQAVDVWFATDSSNNQSVVVWKKLTAEQSHGTIIQYQLLSDNSVKNLTATQHCSSMSSNSAEKRITITALNKAGRSQSSTIMTPSEPAEVLTPTRVTGSDGGLELSWETVPGASCGYVLDWYPTHSQDKCGIEWMKIPAGRNSTRINAGLKDGVRYTFSLYACPSNTSKLLKRWEGYGREQPPDMGPKIHIEQIGHDIILTWEEIPLEHQRGFIQGYVISYSLSSHSDMGQRKTERVFGSERRMQKRITNLFADAYVFWISAFTSGGEGVRVGTTVTLTSHIYQIIVYGIISLGGVITLVLLITILCYRKRAWLKDKVYPDIPAPQLNWSNSKGILDYPLFELPTEHVEHLMAYPVKVSVVNPKVTNGAPHKDYLSLYRSVTDSQKSHPTDCHFRFNLDDPNATLDNPTYNLPVSLPKTNNAAAVTTEADGEGYKPQLPSTSSPLPSCSASSYQALGDVCQCGQPQTTWTLETDDYIAVSSVGSPTSVTSSQPLLEESYRFGHMDRMPN